MKSLAKQMFVEMKLYIREPQAFFFTLIFPLIILFVFGEIFGNDPYRELGGRGNMDVSIPGYIVMVIGTTALLGIPITLASYQERGVLRRMQATPVSPAFLLVVQVLVQLLMTGIGICMLVIAGRWAYDLYLPNAPVAVGTAILLSCLGLFSIGFMLAAIASTARGAQVVGMSLYFPMLFMGGAAIPLAHLPDSIQRVSDFLPLTHAVKLISNLWFGDGWTLSAVLFMGVCLIMGVTVTAFFFRWR